MSFIAKDLSNVIKLIHRVTRVFYKKFRSYRYYAGFKYHSIASDMINHTDSSVHIRRIKTFENTRSAFVICVCISMNGIIRVDYDIFLIKHHIMIYAN